LPPKAANRSFLASTCLDLMNLTKSIGFFTRFPTRSGKLGMAIWFLLA
jgi:hypothetical protein